METQRSAVVRYLLAKQVVAALGTLHHGKPAVSMTPFAVSPESRSLVIHVSGLASHTKDMQADPAVSLLVTADRQAEKPPQALPRLTIAGTARPCAPGEPEYDSARSAYLARFPESEMMFSFGDFSLYLIEPESARVVAGFAQAWSLTRSQYLATMADTEAG
jgi:hypothetical protein